MGDSIRNIERIEEGDDERSMPRGVAVALVVLGAGCIVFAALALGGRTSAPLEKKSDPLGDLLAQRVRPAASGGSASVELSAKDVTFPRMLSDDDHPPTALAAVRPPTPAGPRSAESFAAAASAETAPLTPAPGPSFASTAAQPPPPTDRLPVVPLPAQALLEATPVVTRPRDALTKAASEAARLDSPPSGEAAPPGHDGGYQLQVSSFHTQSEAQAFADQLRARGHKAYVVEANVPGRGTWYRVRIGPFATQRAAAEYRAGFEDREHVVPFVVMPETTARGH
ncbi:MAG TPA: SPOR domain-containing protein [Polyangiaceae bacterium]|nr:SPOR domain-containing protein [Polyangiaceae bacterium]